MTNPREYMAQWRAKNRESVRKYGREWRYAHRKHDKERVCPCCGKKYAFTSNRQKYCAECSVKVRRKQKVEWRLANPDKVIQAGARHYRKYTEKIKARTSAYYADNRERASAMNRMWKLANPDFGRKNRAKRRALGFNPLNSPFSGCEAHHINLNDVIYIPRDMHKSVSHNVWTGRNMEKINALAGAYLTEDWT